MYKIFTILTKVLALAVVVQVFLAGHGVFTGTFHSHRVLGIGILLLAVAVGVAAVLARIPRPAFRTVGLVIGLIVLQPVLARLSTELGSGSTAVGGIVLGLHAVNAFVIAVMLGEVLVQARRDTRDPEDLPALPGERQAATTSTDPRRRAT